MIKALTSSHHLSPMPIFFILFVVFFCRYQCPDQCESAAPPEKYPPQTPAEPDAYGAPAAPPVDSYGSPQSPAQSYSGPASSRRRREATDDVEVEIGNYN